MMRILYITPAFQHPKVRGPKRCYYFVREMSRRHSITLLSLTKSKIPTEAMQEMASYTEQILTFEATNHVKEKKRAFSSSNRIKGALNTNRAISEMKKTFLKLVQENSYDVVIFHGKRLFKVIEDWNVLPIVADFCDATSKRLLEQMRYSKLIELPRLLFRYLEMKQIEKGLLKKISHVAFISCRDRDAIFDSNNNHAQILPLGVDLKYWTRRTRNPRSNCILYTGGMDYPPNADGAFYLIERILPRIRQHISNLEVLIVGRDPSPTLIKKAQQYPDVTITGYVEDMRPYFERASVYVAPLRFASGTQNKLLEAMSMEVPVVTTHIAAEGLRVADDIHPPVSVANGEEEIAERVVHLLRNKQECFRLSVEARSFIQNNFNWVRSTETLEKMCIEAVEKNS